MALVLADRVLETTSVAGTGDASLSGAIVGYQPFSVIGGGNTTYYTIVAIDDNGAPTGDWEVGIGTYVTSGNKISRDTVLSSSNGGALVYFASGTKQIFLDLPSEELPVSSGDVTGPASAVANNFAAFNLTTGKLIKDSGYNASSFATAAQGAKADTAVQPGSLGSAAYLTAGAALGVATLDAGGKVPTSQIPQMGDLNYQGTWNASTNTPTLTSSAGTKGFYYVVSVAGSTNLNGITDWKVGDWAVFNGSVWEKIDNTDAVTSVNGYTGTVVLTASDVGAQPAFTSQTANYVYAAPNGSAGLPTFRALVSADIPSLSGAYIPYTGASAAIDLNAQTVVNINHLGIGTTSVPTILLRAVGDNNSTSRIAVRGYSSNANSSSMRVTKFRGTAGAPQAPQSGDSLGKFELAGYGTTSSEGYPQASFEGVATQSWGAIARGAKTLIKVTPNNTITQVTAVTVDQDSKVTLAGALDVTGTTTLNTSLSGLAKLTSGVVSAATSGTDYAPATSGTSILYGNGSGGFSNVTIGTGVSFAGGTLSATGSGGTVTSVTGTAPIASTGGATPAISISQATTSTNGYLSSTDWNTFNGKGSGTVTSVGGTGTVNGITLTGTVTSTGNLTLGGTLGGIGNSQLTNSAVTIGSTSVSLGATATTLAGLTSVTSTTVVASGVVGSSATGALTMPSGTTAERPGTPATGMVRYNTTLGVVEYYNGTTWYSVTGTNVTPTVEYLVVGGGGAGGRVPGTGYGSGGGAGGFRTATGLAVTAGSAITVTVGAGGTGGGTSTPTSGSNSVFGSITSAGGGSGNTAAANNSAGVAGGSGGGGTGGGGGAGNTPSTSPSQGNNGASGTSGGNGGGGGGASAAASAQNGGAGTASSISGSSVTYAGGGGAGSNGTGGAGGGASAANGGAAGTANTGGGGGGDTLANVTGGAGGSGIVIIRYADTYPLATSTTGSPTVTTAGGYRVYTWTGSGSITF
jgi:hypothetical protein